MLTDKGLVVMEDSPARRETVPSAQTYVPCLPETSFRVGLEEAVVDSIGTVRRGSRP